MNRPTRHTFRKIKCFVHISIFGAAFQLNKFTRTINKDRKMRKGKRRMTRGEMRIQKIHIKLNFHEICT